MIDSSEILDQIHKKNVGGAVFDGYSFIVIFQKEPKPKLAM